MNAQRNSESDTISGGYSDFESSAAPDGFSVEGTCCASGGMVLEDGSFFLEQSRLRVVSLYQTLVEKRSMRF